MSEVTRWMKRLDVQSETNSHALGREDMNTVSESPASLYLGTSVDHDRADGVNCLSYVVEYCTCSGALTKIEIDSIIRADLPVIRGVRMLSILTMIP